MSGSCHPRRRVCHFSVVWLGPSSTTDGSGKDETDGVVQVRFASLRLVAFGTVVGYLLGDVIGIGGPLGSLVVTATTTGVQSIMYFKPSLFRGFRRARSDQARRARLAQPPWLAALTNALVNLTFAFAVLGALTLLLAVFYVRPHQVGLALTRSPTAVCT